MPSPTILQEEVFVNTLRGGGDRFLLERSCSFRLTYLAIDMSV